MAKTSFKNDEVIQLLRNTLLYIGFDDSGQCDVVIKDDKFTDELNMEHFLVSHWKVLNIYCFHGTGSLYYPYGKEIEGSFFVKFYYIYLIIETHDKREKTSILGHFCFTSPECQFPLP